MEKSIITFSANEQNLQKTGGIGCYASDTVSYIEAQFTLGENWSGYDSIRAVWFNDYQTISTVLDPNGVCIVPHEVLVNRAKVMVNLVGSVLVSDELSDRLTTFPCEALKVSAKAKISGSETAEITPSQFDQFVDIVIAEVEKVTGMTAQAETLPAGSQATARYENGILYLGIPQGIQGERGETGADGNGIASVVYNADYTLTLVFTNGERFTTPPIRGERGPAGADGRDGTDGRDGADGVTPNLSIGTVETLEPSEDAYVTRRGTDANPIFDFGIPKGDTGTVPDLDLILPTDTASGGIVSITDGQSVVPVKSLQVTLDPIQDLHGYDKPWSGGAGKNKFPNMTEGSYSTTSLSVNVNEYGTAKATSTEYGTVLVPLDEPITVQTGQKLIYVGDFTGAIYFLENGTSVDYWTATGSTREITDISSLVGRTIDAVRILVNGAITAKSISIMLVDNSVTDYTYEPYSNICPISGHTEVDTEVCGKNLFDINSETFKKWGLYSNAFRSLSDDSTVVEISGVADDAVTYVTNSTYCGIGFIVDAMPLERVVSVPQSIGGAVQFWSAYEDGATRLSTGATSCTIPANTSGFVALRTDTRATTTTTIQLELGSTATDYEPYNGHTYTTTLGQTVYGGTLDVVSGELVVDRAIADMGSLVWNKLSDGRFYTNEIVGAKAGSSSGGYDTFICSAYEAVNVGSVGSLPNGSASMDGGRHLQVRDDAYTDASSFKTAVTGVQLCYELATPQTYQLDPQTISLLKGNNNVWSDGEVEMVYNADVQLWVLKQLGTSGTRTLSMTRTVETKSEETKTDDVKTDAELTKSDNIQLAED